MSDMNTQKDLKSSPLAESYRNAKTIKQIEMVDLRVSLPLWSIVCIEEFCNKPYVLIGKEDKSEENIWIEYNGEDKETLSKYYEWFESGKKLYNEKSPKPEDLDELRKIVVSIGEISNLLYNEVPAEINNLLSLALTKIAVKWFLRDHPNHPSDIESVVNNEESSPYLEMVMQYVLSFSSMVSSMACEVLGNL